MRATEVVKVTGGEPPVEGGRGGVVAPLEGGQTGLDCARGQRLARELAACAIEARLAAFERRDDATATTFDWRFTASDLDDLRRPHRQPRTSADHGRVAPSNRDTHVLRLS